MRRRTLPVFDSNNRNVLKKKLFFFNFRVNKKNTRTALQFSMRMHLQLCYSYEQHSPHIFYSSCMSEYRIFITTMTSLYIYLFTLFDENTHEIAYRSDDMVARYLSFGSHATPCTKFLCSFKWNLLLPFITSHTMAVQPTSPDAKNDESIDQDKSRTSSKWPRNVLKMFHVSLFCSLLSSI